MHDMVYVFSLIGLLLVSGFFSSSETAMMRLNRYRMRHQSINGHRGAKRIMSLLVRPDRLLSLILIGNTLANVLASSVVTVLAVRWYGHAGVAISAFVLTLVILIFAEVMPKTMAALYPERWAYPVSFVLKGLMWLMYPVVWLINGVSNVLLAMCRLSTHSTTQETLSRDELKTIVREAMGDRAVERQRMLLRILDLEKITVNDVMIPRRHIEGIDLDANWSSIRATIESCAHTWLPVYRGSFDQVVGVLQLHRAYKAMLADDLDKESLMALVDEAYYIPECTSLSAQLVHFREQHHIGIVVDEYGDVLGLLTLEDVLEEIVGEFSLRDQGIESFVTEQEDGTFHVSGAANIRDLNRTFGWSLPLLGPVTLSGVIIEILEAFPEQPVCLWMNQHRVEILKVDRRRILQVKLWPEKNGSANAERD